MSIYRRKNRDFNERLAVRRDELSRATPTADERGRVTLSALPYLLFPNSDCAEQFVRRVLMQRERLSAEGKPTRRMK